MKLNLALCTLLVTVASTVAEKKRALKMGKKGRTGKGGTTYQPGNFGWGSFIRDKYDRRILVANGIVGRPLAYTNEPVEYADGSFSSMNYHARADGGAVFLREDDMGYIYVSNDESGSASDPTGGVYALKLNEDHEVVDYYQILSDTADNCAGGRTPWGTWVSCEEETGYGYCWQTDPEGVIAGEVTAVAQYPSNWEGFAWDDEDSPPRGYTTDDSYSASTPYLGALARFTPDATALECYAKETKAERWCTLNSGTDDYLVLEPGLGGCGAFSWTDDADLATPGLYRKGEGIDITDGILTFDAKTDHLWFELDLREGTYCQYSTLPGFKQQPDNLRVFGDVTYFCTDSGAPNGIFGYDGDGWFGLVMAPDFGSEAAGVDFTPDGKYMYMSFQTEMTWVFWREDGKAFDDKNDGISYINDSSNVYFADGGYSA